MYSSSPEEMASKLASEGESAGVTNVIQLPPAASAASTDLDVTEDVQNLYSCVLNKRAGTLIFRWFNFPPAHTLLFSTCTIIGNYIHTYKANIANIQTARLFVPARLLRTQE